MTTLPPLPSLIGLSGYAGSGKDTLAGLLAERCGYQVAHFADPLRELCRRVNPILGTSMLGQEARWSDTILDDETYAAMKAHPTLGPELRGFMQRLGTEARAVLGEDVWIDAAFAHFDIGRPTVFADMCLPSEAEALSSYADVGDGAILIRVERPGVGPAGETALDDWPFPMVVDNDGAPEWMLEQIATEFTLPEVAR